jgi:hypothetical protein
VGEPGANELRPDGREPRASERGHRLRRLIGFLLLAICIGLVVMLFTPGAGEVAERLGKKCPRSLGGHYQQCHALDVVGVVVFVSPWLLLIGLALIGSPLVARRPGNDRGRFSRPR